MTLLFPQKMLKNQFYRNIFTMFDRDHPARCFPLLMAKCCKIDKSLMFLKLAISTSYSCHKWKFLNDFLLLFWAPFEKSLFIAGISLLATRGIWIKGNYCWKWQKYLPTLLKGRLFLLLHQNCSEDNRKMPTMYLKVHKSLSVMPKIAHKIMDRKW